MMLNDDLDYWRARVMQEQEAARQATCDTARLVHDELAAMCKSKIGMLVPPVRIQRHPAA
jgi:hypothetical protein